MSIENTRKALFEAYNAMGLAYPVQLENVDFSPGEASIWVRLSFIPTIPVAVSLGTQGQDEMRGVMQIDLNQDKGKGVQGLEDLVDQIRISFTAGQIFAYDSQEVTIVSCGRENAQEVDSYFRIPVSVIWYSRLQRNLTLSS